MTRWLRPVSGCFSGMRRVSWQRMTRISRLKLMLSAAAFAAVVAIIAGMYVWSHPRADEFLGDADFEGAPIAGPTVTNGGQSYFNGFLTITNLNRSLVEAVLPSGFELAPNVSFWHQTKHPVLLLFGDQTDGALVIGGVARPTPPLNRSHYSELILAIPYVRRTGGSDGWHTYVARMYLDSVPAVAAGALFGYAKELGCLDWQGKNVSIRQALWICPGSNPLTSALLDGDFRFYGTWYDGSSAYAQIPNLSDMVGMVTTKILGKNASGDSICSFFEWNLDDARIAKAMTSHQFQAPFRSTMGAWPGLGVLNNVSEGAVVLNGVRWRLASAPVSCGFP